MSDVITVPSHTKKDNPKAALKPIHAVNDANPPLRRHPARPGTRVQALVVAFLRNSQTRAVVPGPGAASTRQNSSSGWPGPASGRSRQVSRLMTQCSRIERMVYHRPRQTNRVGLPSSLA